jgi:PAS domain S-box-containing protein
VVVDRDGHIRLVNRQTELLFGYTRQDLLGQPIERLIPERLHAAHQRHRAEYDAAPHTRPMGTNLPLHGRRQDGSEFPVAVSLAPLVDGDETFVIASIRDATDLQLAQAANEELRRLQAVTDTALAHLDLDALLPELLLRVRDVLQADHVTILLLGDDSQMLEVRAEVHAADDAPAWRNVPVGVGFAGHVAASRAPLVVADLSTFSLVRPQLRQSLRSAVGVPLLAGEQLLGVLCIGAAQARHFSPHDVALLEQAAARITTAVARSQLFAAEQAARRALEREHARWQAAMESTPEYVITCDANVRTTYVNPAYARLRGGPADLAVPVEERPTRYGLFLPDGENHFPAEQLPLTRAVREGWPVHEIGMLLRTPEGEERLIEWEAAPMYSAEGDVLGAVAIGHDITERRQLEREREAARADAERRAEELDRVFEAMAEPVVVLDPAGRTVRDNDAMRRLRGPHGASEAYGQLPLAERTALYELRDRQGQVLAPEDNPLMRALRGEVVSGRDAMDLRLRTLDGREVELRTSAVPLRDADGRIVGAVSVGVDQTERNRLERELETALVRAQSRSAELEAVLGAMTDGVVVYDPTGHITYMNAAFRTLFAVETRPDYERLSLAERAALVRCRTPEGQLLPMDQLPQARVLRGEVPVGEATADLVGDALDGRTLTLHLAGSPLRDAAGGITGAVLVFRDVTAERQLQRATRELAAQLHATVQAMSDAVLLYDPEGRVLRLNAAAQALVDAEPEFPSVAGTDWWERVRRLDPRRPDGQPLPLEEWPLVRVLRGETLTVFEETDVVLTDAQGHRQVFTYVGGPVQDVDGKLMGYVFVVRDITARWQLERTNAEQAEQLTRIFEGIEDGLVVYDADGYVVRENAAVRRLLGLDSAPPDYYRSSVFDRAHMYEVRDERGQLLPPGDWPQVRILRGQGVSRVEELEGWVRTLDGREVYLRVTASPLRDQEGRLVGAVTILHDQTERNRLERERAEQAAQLNRIFEGITDGVVVYDAAGNVMRTNLAARRLLGLDVAPSEYAQLRPVARAVLYQAHDEAGNPLGAEDWPLVRVLHGQVGPDGEGREVRLRMLDGREVDVYTSAAPLRDAAGRLLGAVTILHDQSERRLLEEARANEMALRELNARLDTFATIAAHDLSAPVSVSRMVVQRAQYLLQQAATKAEHAGREHQAQVAAQAAQAVETSRHNLDHLWRLAEQLLDVSRVREGTLVLDRKLVDLVELVRSGVEEQRLLNPTRVLTFALPDPLAAPIVVEADPDRLSQVLSNYLSNAVRYSPESQPIAVTLEVVELAPEDGGGRVARVAVRDHGSGIPPEEQATIWDRFQRASNALEAEGGLGLGLYIARTIVERHGGQVGVDSVVGQGSTFWFTVPVSHH